MPRLTVILLGFLMAGAHAVPIVNTAALHARGLRVTSNTVTLDRAAPCDPRVTPDGSAARPGRTVTLRTPGSTVLPYTVTQAGTRAGTVAVTAAVTGAPGVQVRVQEDPVATLAPGESRTYHVVVLATSAAVGSADVTFTASCGAASDAGNVTRVQLSPHLDMTVTHTVTPGRVEVGRIATFTVGVTNPAAQPVTPAVTVTLPAGITYRPGSARMNGEPVPATVSADGRTVTFHPPAVNAGETLHVTYDALIGPEVAPDGTERRVDVPGRASATVDGTAVTSNVATAHVIVTPGVFDRRATVVGEVFLDADGDGRRDPTDAPLAGARVLLANGRHALTDAQGRYALRGVEPGPWLLRLDPATAPFSAVPGAGDRLVDVFGLTRVDFALRVPVARPAADAPGTPAGPGAPRDTTVRSGPLVVTRRVVPQPGGASVVTLRVSSARPVVDVVVIDRGGPDGEAREFRAAALSDPITFTYVTLTPAGPNDPDVLWSEP